MSHILVEFRVFLQYRAEFSIQFLQSLNFISFNIERAVQCLLSSYGKAWCLSGTDSRVLCTFYRWRLMYVLSTNYSGVGHLLGIGHKALCLFFKYSWMLCLHARKFRYFLALIGTSVVSLGNRENSLTQGMQSLVTRQQG